MQGAGVAFGSNLGFIVLLMNILTWQRDTRESATNPVINGQPAGGKTFSHFLKVNNQKSIVLASVPSIEYHMSSGVEIF